jgi:hypothetical protein
LIFLEIDDSIKLEKGEGGVNMETLKEEAINAISKLPESVDIDEIMYRLYVIDKIRKGQKAILEGKTISLESLKEEMKSW